MTSRQLSLSPPEQLRTPNPGGPPSMGSDAFLQRIRLAFTIAVGAMALFGVASYMTVTDLADFMAKALGGERNLVAVERVESSLSRSRAALRAYIMSASSTDLARFERRLVEQGSSIELLGEAPSPPEHSAVQTLAGQQAQLLVQAAELHKAGSHESAQDLLSSAAIGELDVRLHRLLHDIRAREESWVRASAGQAARSAQQVGVAAACLLLFLLAWSAWVIRFYEQERKRAGARLEANRSMGRAIASSMAEGLVTLSSDLRVVSINEAGLQLLGYSEHEVVGMEMSAILAADEPEVEITQVLAALLAAPASIKLTGLDMTGIHKAGGEVPLRMSVSEVRIGARRLLSLLLHDMRDIRGATDALKSREEQLRQITDALPVLIAELDTEQRFRFHNKACEEFFGATAGELQQSSLVELMTPELYAAHRPHLEAALRGETQGYEVTATAADGKTRQYAMHMIPRRADDRSAQVSGLYAFATDITALKRIDQMKSEFVSTVSHELRTPLTSIRGALGLLAGGVTGKLPDPATSLVGIAKSSCDRLIRLINDMLDVDRIESGKLPLRLEVAEIAPLVKQALVANQAFAGQHQVALRLVQTGQGLHVRVDADRLLQVLTNLISNAVKFSSPGMSVDVRVTADARSVRIAVTDRGPGVPEEFRNRIFEKFSQADSSDTRAKGGTGLGLNICRTLVEKMGGTIGFSSTVGAGATFHFQLPRQAAGHAPAAAPSAPAPLELARALTTDATAPKRRVLHLDSDGDIRAIVSDLARDCAVCISAGSVQDARDRLAEARFDVILLEPELESGSGWELFDVLDAMDSPPPVIVFSAQDETPPLHAQVQAVLVKAHTSEAELVRAIQRSLGFTQPAPLTVMEN